MFTILSTLLVLFPWSALSLPAHLSSVPSADSHSRSHLHSARSASLVEAAGSFPELDTLLKGNNEFRDKIAASDPELLQTLTTEGQHPDFMFLGCRSVSESSRLSSY